MTTDAPAYAGQGDKHARAYVLGALTVVYVFNFVDRSLIGILQEPIKHTFHLSDLQLGLLGGPAFAILYTLTGLPIAHVAERRNRITIVAIGLALWSAATAACGFAGTYLQLFAARVAVGIGEAACTPPSHSVISDYFPSNRRASALGIYALGVPIGTMAAALGAGWLAQHYNWSVAFIAIGAPGLVLAILLKLTVREPKRSGAIDAASFRETLRVLASKRSFWMVAIGGALIGFVGYGTSQFLVSMVVRFYHLPQAQASFAFAVIAGVSVGFGTFLGGALTDRLSAKHPHVLFWLPALGMAVALPLYLLSFFQAQFLPAFAIILVAAFFHYFYIGPMFAMAHGVVQPRMRATATAILLLVINLIGYTFGPLFVGATADFLASRQLAEDGLTLSACKELKDNPICAAASAVGLRNSMAATVCMLVAPALLFWFGRRTWLADRVS